MPTKKPALEKPLTVRQHGELIIYSGLIAGTAVQVLNADNGEVYARLTEEASHAYDVFLKMRVEGVGK